MGEPGKFVAVYLRGVDQRQGLKFDIEIQGQHLTIDLPSKQQQAAQSIQRAWYLGLGAAILIALFLMGSLTLQRRAAEADRITELETLVKHRAHEADGIARAKGDAEALARLGLDNRTLDQALADLKDLSLNRDPAVRVDAFYWNKGYWAVEARGVGAPISDATVALQRSDKPVRKGVWLWVSAREDGQ